MKTLNKLVKVGAVSPRIRLCDVAYNVDECIAEAKRANELGARVLVFPELTFSGVTCFDLYLHSVLVNRIEKGVADFIEATKDLDMISFVGAPVMVDSACYNSVVAIYRGEILGIAPKAYVSPEQSRYFDVPTGEVLDVTYAGRDTVLDPDTVITAPFDEDLKIGVTYGEGANLVVNLMASEATLDSEKLRIRTVRAMSGAEGKAYIYCTLDGNGAQRYEIEISKINRDSTEGKSFTVKVTDPSLIEKTGGIVQGMSGSPIIQNGKLVGAVTHVLINDPTTGYGIFIENMLAAVKLPMAKAS